jgi:hypothetical protein
VWGDLFNRPDCGFVQSGKKREANNSRHSPLCGASCLIALIAVLSNQERSARRTTRATTPVHAIAIRSKRVIVGSRCSVYFSRTISLRHYSGDDNLIRVIDGDLRIQNLDRFIYVLRMADWRMNHSKSDHDFNPEIRGGHVRSDARA